MTPERIRDIVPPAAALPKEAIKNNAEELQQHTFDFNYLIRTQDSEAKQTEILECIADDPAGLFYLAIPSSSSIAAIATRDERGLSRRPTPKRKIRGVLAYSERQQSEDAHDYPLDDPRSLLMLIREQASRGGESDQPSLLRSENATWDGIINKFANELVMQAKEKNQVSDEYDEVDDMFSFLD